MRYRTAVRDLRTMSMKQSGCRHRECRSSFGVTDARESAEPKASINTLIVVVEPDDIVLPSRPPTLPKRSMSNAFLPAPRLRTRARRVSPVRVLLLSFYRAAFHRWRVGEAGCRFPGPTREDQHHASKTSAGPTFPIAREGSKRSFCIEIDSVFARARAEDDDGKDGIYW